MLQRARRPLAVLGIVLSIIGVLDNILGVDMLFRPADNIAVTHPTTAICLIILCIGLINHRPNKRTPKWRFLLGGAVFAYLLSLLVWRAVLGPDVVFLPPDMKLGAMGSDTAMILTLLYAAVLLRRGMGKVGLAFAVAATFAITVAFIAISYGQDLFEGEMAVTTLIALLPITTAMLTIFAQRPIMRIMFLAGPVGLRTRMTMIVGFFVPWIGGLILHHVTGVPDRGIPAEAMTIGAIILSIVLVAVASGHFHEKVDRSRRELSRRLADMATMDQLTQTLNRNGIMAELDRRWTCFRSEKRQQCLMIMDLDHFKDVNDTHGHDEGDRVLATVSKMLRPQLRNGDAVGRWGGEEFMILIEGMKPDNAVLLANRLRQSIANLPRVLGRPGDDGATLPYRVTASFGVAFFQAEDVGVMTVIKRADQALYDAKHQGRNRVSVALGTENKAA